MRYFVFGLILFSVFNSFVLAEYEELDPRIKPISVSATVSEISVLNSVSRNSTSLGVVNIDPSRVWIDGLTNLPGSVSNETDPWTVAAESRVKIHIDNNVPGDFLIYTDHRNQSYFPNNVPTERDITGLINPRYIDRYQYLSSAPLVAWADINNEHTESPSPTSNWVWITDSSGSIKNKLLPYSLIVNKDIWVYFRSAFAYPKLPGDYVATVFIQFDRY